MTIILSTTADVSANNGLNVFGAIGEALGIKGLDNPAGRVTGANAAIQDFANNINGVVNALTGQGNTEQFDPNFVGSGREVIVGGYIEGGKVPPLEDASIRQVYSQTPTMSVIIKKRTFSSLGHLNDPTLMDPADLWLMRATKKLISNKCVQMAQYERLSKIAALIDKGASPQAIMASIITTALDEEVGDANAFSSARALEKAALDRQPPSITTYYVDPDLPILEDLGPGTGTFEITVVADVQTGLGLDGEGSCSFNIEDPYRILIVTEEDIETALRDTALSSFVRAISLAATMSLDSAQSKDAQLSSARRARNRSEISFTIGVGGNAGVRAVLDAIGFQITADNLADVPDNQSLDASETALFKSILFSLETYEQAMRKNLLQGIDSTNAKSIRNEMEYARKRLRVFHLGKAIIQPMDQIHVFVDSATRKSGEGEDVQQGNDIFTAAGALGVAGSILGLQDEAQIDDELLQEEWLRDGQHMTFGDFKRLRMMQPSGESGMQVFEGLVSSVVDKFDANSGKHTLTVSTASNMEWLKISRFNKEPSLDQTQGVLFDPLTPFKFETDPATGLPRGKPQLLDANVSLLAQSMIYYPSPPFRGVLQDPETDLATDLRVIGGISLPIYQHAPGFVYRWKEGIMTATYNVNMSVANPLDETKTSAEQLRRDVGWYPSHTPFDNMDSANIISVLVTGQPYNLVSFIQSAQNSGTWSKDVSTNSGKDFFHSFLDIQRSINKVQGNFVPFKHITVDEDTFAKAMSLQWKLTDRSSKLGQLQTQQARDNDRLRSLGAMGGNNDLVTQLQQKVTQRGNDIQSLTSEINGLSQNGQALQGGLLEFVGNSIIVNADASEKPPVMFGDRLIHAVMKRREFVVRNRDKDYLIISDDYDNDYDILAFAQQLKEQGPNLYQSTYLNVHQLCKQVADTLDFEFFADTQGNIVFRPPQYNRTPASVLNKVIALNWVSGIKIYPDFLTSLFQSREQSLIDEIVATEWEIRMKAALLGYTTVQEVEQMIFGGANTTGGFFITDSIANLRRAGNRADAQPEEERQALYMQIAQSVASAQLNQYGSGAFTPIGQQNAVRQFATAAAGTVTTAGTAIDKLGAQAAYEQARDALYNLTGRQLTDSDSYDKVKVGMLRNGMSTPDTDIERIIGDIASLVSARTKQLQMLSKLISQNIEAGIITADGSKSVVQQPLHSTLNMDSGLYRKLIEDDAKNVLGHLSGARFIIKDEDIISSQYTEAPPELTSVTVNGTQPLVGSQGGNLADYPQYKAYGVDFDLWRQYGFRADKEMERPFLWDADRQCAPYAMMLLSRQKRDVVKGTLVVRGNEYYQLGDVVYVQERQMLYYVWKISHNFGYNQQFQTTLDLRYGHPPGEYIPTPLDVIGKNLALGGTIQSSFRVRRQIPGSAQVLGVVVFDKNSTKLLEGSHANRNCDELKNAVHLAKPNIASDDPKSPRVYLIAFGGDYSEQQTRMKVVADWFNNPQVPGEKGNQTTITDSTQVKRDIDPSKFRIDPKIIRTQFVEQDADPKKLTDADKLLLYDGIVASEKTRLLDRTLQNVIEIRLRQPPIDGWQDLKQT